MKEFGSDEERSEYANSCLNKVKELLDGLAEDTGMVFVTLSLDYVNAITRLQDLIERGITDSRETAIVRLTKAGYRRDYVTGEWSRDKTDDGGKEGK